MANSSNAFITKQANSVDPSDWINKQQEISQYYDQVAAQKEREKLAREDKLRGEFKDDFEGEFDLSSMGNDAVNKVFTPMAMQSLQDLKQAKDEGEKALSQYGINSKEYMMAKSKYDTILQRPKQFKLAFEQTASKLNGYNKLVQEGKIIQNPSNIENLQKIVSTPIKYKQDANGNYLLMQGENAYTMDEFADKLDLGKMIPKVDEQEIINGITESIGDKEFERINGYRTIKTTNPWEDYENPETKETQQGIKSILTRGFKSALTDEVAESVLASRGQFGYSEMPQETKDQLKAKIVDEWTQIGRGQISEKLGVDFDSSRYNNDSDNARADRKEQKTTITEVTEPTKDTFPNYHGISNGKAVGVSGAKTISSIKTETWDNGEPEYIKGKKNPKWKGNKGEVLSNVKPLAFTMDNKGRLIASVSYADGIEMTDVQIEKLSQEVVGAEVLSNDPKQTKEDRDLYKKVAETKKKTLQKAQKGFKNVVKDVVVAKDREFEFAEASGLSVEELKAKLQENKSTEAGILD